MEQSYLWSCTRYVELNPVRAGLVKKPAHWPWSSTAPHMAGNNDILVKTKPLLELVNKSWKSFLGQEGSSQTER
jgi:putative transposase